VLTDEGVAPGYAAAVAFPRKLLNDGEELVLDLRPHWLYLAPATVLLVVSVIVSLFVAFAWDPGGNGGTAVKVAALVALVAALAYFGLKYASWATTMFVLTSDRLLTRRGVLSKSGIEIPLESIVTVFFHQSVFERMVGAGDLAVESAGTKGTESFSDIRKPAIVHREIYVQKEANDNRMRAPQPGGSTAGISVAEQIEKLHALVQQGALTPAQFEAEKAKLLGS